MVGSERRSIIWRRWHTLSLFPAVIGTGHMFPEGLAALLSASQKAPSQCHFVHILLISCFFANGFVSCDATACARPIRIDQDNAIQGHAVSTFYPLT